MEGRLKGKIALISGTGGGQGRAAAVLFAKEGAKVVGCDLKVDGAKETVEMVKASGGEMVSIQPCDLGDGDHVKQWINFAVSTYGRIDILYNNASDPKFVPIDQMTEDEWRFTVRNELDLIYFSCHHAWTAFLALYNTWSTRKVSSRHRYNSRPQVFFSCSSCHFSLVRCSSRTNLPSR